jgi:hypothetical protein
MNTDSSQQHATLQQIARRAMSQRGLLTEPSREAAVELDNIQAPPARTEQRETCIPSQIAASISPCVFIGTSNAPGFATQGPARQSPGRPDRAEVNGRPTASSLAGTILQTERDSQNWIVSGGRRRRRCGAILAQSWNSSSHGTTAGSTCPSLRSDERRRPGRHRNPGC